jgi:ribose transport system substrate-binding protein
MRRVVVGLALSAALLGVVACGGSDSGDSSSSGGSSTASSSGDANKHVNIAHFVAIQANPVEQVIIKSAKDTGKANNATVTTFDSNNDVQRELANCQDAIASKKYDAFVLKAVSGPPLIPCARAAMAAGIPVVVQGTALGPKQTTEPQVEGIVGSAVTLSTTNGVAVADLTNKACEKAGANPCKVIYLFGPVAFDYASITRKTFNDTGKAKYPNIQVVSQVGADAIKAGKQFGDTVILPATEAEAATLMAIKAARKQDVGDTTIDVTKDLSPVGTIVDASNVDKYKPEW